MKELSVGKIRRSLKRFEDFASDLARSDMNTFNDRLRMLMDYCKSDPVLSLTHNQLMSMPGVDFDSWHKGVSSTLGGMVGSGDLSFPTDLDKRMALMYQLLSKVDNEEIDLIDFSHDFFATGDNRIDSLIYAFNDAVVEPLCRELSYRIEDLEEELPEDNREEYPLANIQIVHNAQNVIQQTASGKNIRQHASIEHNDELKELFSELRSELKSQISDPEEIDNAMQIVDSSEEMATNGQSSLPSLKVLLGSLGAMGNVGSIVSAILTVVATIG